jgi:hypothetical protein
MLANRLRAALHAEAFEAADARDQEREHGWLLIPMKKCRFGRAKKREPRHVSSVFRREHQGEHALTQSQLTESVTSIGTRRIRLI